MTDLAAIKMTDLAAIKMTDLAAILNKGHEQVGTTLRGNLFDVKMGSIPHVVPLFRKEGRTFAGGRIIFQERLDALRSKDLERINAWGDKYYDLADACITFEDLVKFQADSPLLTGIRGIVETSHGSYVAIDAEAVSKATDGKMKYFRASPSETVHYGQYGQDSKKVQDVVLLRYVFPKYVELNANQFNSIDAKALKRQDFINGRDMKKAEIIREGEIIHPAYRILYPNDLINPLVQETFKHNKREHDYSTNMGLFLSSEPENSAGLRALCAGRFGRRSILYDGSNFGDNYGRLVGIAQLKAELVLMKSVLDL